ncbi:MULTISPECIES: hypothetical protein [Nocardia]|uniref:hypothetical protein n=1 Tax=Nocardia TaxID=1817 RepID=UPI000D699EC0|nr:MULTISPECIES: hypothetical protein [Nocardia]
MYLDLLTNASLLDHSVWASPDIWASDTFNTALDLAAKKKKKSSKGGLIGVICCVLVVVAIIVGIVYFTKRNKN